MDNAHEIGGVSCSEVDRTIYIHILLHAFHFLIIFSSEQWNSVYLHFVVWTHLINTIINSGRYAIAVQTTIVVPVTVCCDGREFMKT